MKNYQAGLEKETEWIDDAYSKLQTQPPPEVKPKENLDQTRVSPTSKKIPDDYGWLTISFLQNFLSSFLADFAEMTADISKWSKRTT